MNENTTWHIVEREAAGRGRWRPPRLSDSHLILIRFEKVK